MTSVEDYFAAIAQELRAMADELQATSLSTTMAIAERSMTGGGVDGEWPDLPADEEERYMARYRLGQRLKPLTDPLMREAALTGTTAHLQRAAGEPVRISWCPTPDARSSSWIGPLRITPVDRSTPPPAEPRTERVADNDPDEIERLLAARGHTAGFSEAEIAAAEAQRGVSFPAELRRFFSLVRSGTVLGTGEGRARFAEVTDGLLAGTDTYGNVVDPWQRAARPDEPLPAMPEPTDDDIVQPLLADPHWIVFADDGGGNAYALDLVPGPKGRIGQVVQFDHELTEPPLLVAWSLTDFLAGKKARAPKRKAAASDTAGKHAWINGYRDKEDFEPGELDGATSVLVSTVAEFDVARLAELDTLRSVEFSNMEGHELAHLEALATLPNLAELRAGGDVWQSIAQAGGWPPALEVAEVSNGVDGFLGDVAAANAVLTHYDLPPIELHEATLD